MTTNRFTEEAWRPRGDWRKLLATVVSMLIYSVPCFVFEWRWPMHLQDDGTKRFPPVSLTLGLGVGWLVVMVAALALLVPSTLAWDGHPEMARRRRHGALHAAWFGAVVTSVSAGMRFPLAPLFQVISAMRLVSAELLALRWLARRVQDDVGGPARPSS